MKINPYNLACFFGHLVRGVRNIYVDYCLGRSSSELYQHVFRFGDDILKALKVEVVVEGTLDVAPAIICMNHTSALDGPTIMKFPGRKYFGAKKEAFGYPFMGMGLRMLDMPMIDRSDHGQAIKSLDNAVDMICRECETGTPAYLMMFPEGTRKNLDSYVMGEFKKGAFRLSAKSGLAIIPVASYGAAELLPKRSLACKPGTVYLRILPAIYPGSGGDEKEIADVLLRQARTALEDALEELELVHG